MRSRGYQLPAMRTGSHQTNYLCESRLPILLDCSDKSAYHAEAPTLVADHVVRRPARADHRPQRGSHMSAEGVRCRAGRPRSPPYPATRLGKLEDASEVPWVTEWQSADVTIVRSGC